MKKFRLVLEIGNCENFGTEWEETKERVINDIAAENKEDVEYKYNEIINDCDVRSYYIEEIGGICYEVIVDNQVHYFETLDNAIIYFRLMENQCDEISIKKSTIK